ncbi:MAG TPA: cation:proton antiporter [Thermoanaerobaculia bacterium]|nr:cation:proton antiporter [Thermoanaerobaculia bacterium]
MRKTWIALAVLAVALLWLSGPPTGAQPETPGAPAVPAEEDAAEHAPAAGHTSPVLPVLLGVVIILTTAKLGGALFERFHQPAVLGELIVGVVLGNLVLFGYDGLEFLGTTEGIEILAEIGVILLLFEVGLESNLDEMKAVGKSSLVVALLGVVAPFFLGWGVSAWMIPDEELLVHLFIGATLCATSVGITARVLADLGKLQKRESRIVLGAAVIDDILGLVILAVVAGVITAAGTGGTLSSLAILWIVAKAVLFLGAAILVGTWLSPRLFRVASKLRIQGWLLMVSLVFCFSLAYLSNLIGLATIVGAFAAGLILDEVHYRDFLDAGEHSIEELLHPIYVFLVPIFFVLMGIRVDLSTFGEVSVLGFAAMLTIAAIVGKMICAAGVLEKGLDRISVAVGMVPRGEVGLIFASIGASLVLHGEPVISNEIYSAVVIMVIVTTLLTPPTLKATLARGERRQAAAAPEPPPAAV